MRPVDLLHEADFKGYMKEVGLGLELLLIRHGESLHNIGASSLKDSLLSPRGIVQARQTGEALRGENIQRIYSSLVHRALETAEVISGILQAPCIFWRDLAESHFCWDEPGHGRSALCQRFPMFEFPAEATEEGWAAFKNDETEEEVLERMGGIAEAFFAMAQAEPEAIIAVIIHGNSGNALLKRFFGMSHSGIYFHHGNCGITRLRINPDRTINVFAMNDERHKLEEPLSTVTEYI
ncbi:hypothetical protein DQG13_02375 [Paenibacillus sp. YN15]|nr:hypothetical protein DQG13_02375 [Paenibacillus sp. YN15]